MINFNKKTITWGVGVLAITVAVYGYFTGFGFIKTLVGYNVPPLKEIPETVKNNGKLNFLNLPAGFKISIFAQDLEGPRVIAFDPGGKMLVSETKAGRVTKIGTDGNKEMVLGNLNKPHGIDFYEDPDTGQSYLYVAEAHQVARYLYDSVNSKVTFAKGENIVSYSSDGRHTTRTIAFGPNFRKKPILGGALDTLSDIKLYVSVGSSCDVCVESNWKRGAILESDPEGSFTAEFAGGLRNSVFFAFHPKTGQIWATDMGRDNLGDNLPPDEINIIKAPGPEDEFGAKRYGWPFCYGNRVKDAKFNPGQYERIDLPSDCQKTIPPVIEIPAHSAPLGLAFVPASAGWGKDFKNDLLVAYHGSWNRSEPTGYKIVRFNLDEDGNVLGGEKDFITGWLDDDEAVFGRPVDLKFDSGGKLYITDDAAGIIYMVELIDKQ